MKKITPAVAKKMEVSEIIAKVFTENGIEVLSGDEFGFTAGTVVLRFAETDVQVKLITPAKNLHYSEKSE